MKCEVDVGSVSDGWGSAHETSFRAFRYWKALNVRGHDVSV